MLATSTSTQFGHRHRAIAASKALQIKHSAGGQLCAIQRALAAIAAKQNRLGSANRNTTLTEALGIENSAQLRVTSTGLALNTTRSLQFLRDLSTGKHPTPRQAMPHCGAQDLPADKLEMHWLLPEKALTSVSGRPNTARKSSLLAVTLDSKVDVRSEVVDRAEPALSPPVADPTSLRRPLASAAPGGLLADASSGSDTCAFTAPAACPAAFAVSLYRAASKLLTCMRSCHSATELLRLSELLSATLRALATSSASNWLASRTRSVADASLLLAWCGDGASGTPEGLRRDELAWRDGARDAARLLTIPLAPRSMC